MILKGIPFLTIDTGEGLFYKVSKVFNKVWIFLSSICFWRPSASFIGISFMYKNLFKKMKELKKGDEGEEGEGKDEGGGDAGESNA